MKVLPLLGLTLLLAACDGAGTGLTGPEDIHRGEADAVNPARNVTVICEKDKNGNIVTVTTNITNNCNKNNPVTTEGAAE